MATEFEPREVSLRDGRPVCIRAILPSDLLDEPGHCEVAISIVDAWAGAGLGPPRG